MGNVLAISTMLLAMSGALVILNFVGPTALTGVGALALLTLVVAGIAAVLGVLAYLDVAPSIETAKAISTLLLAMSGALVVLGVVGLMGPAAFIGIGALATLITGIGTLVVAIGALMTKFPQLEEFLNKGIPVLEKIGYALGGFFGNIVGGFIGGVSNGLVDLGNDLSAFMEAANGFIEGAKNVDTTVVNGVKALAESIVILTGSNILDKLFGGGSSLDNIGDKFISLGEGLQGFVTSIGVFTEEQAKSAQNAATAIKALAQAAAEIPNAGGLLADLVGENDMATWAQQLPIMATGIVGFIKIMSEGGIEDSAIKTAETGAKIIKTLAKAAEEIPNSGGLLAMLVGNNDLSTFATQFPIAARGIVGFIKAMSDGEITEDKANVANTAAKVIKTLAEAASEVPNSGGLLAGLVGDNDLSKFATQLPNVGKGIAGFAKELGEFNSSKLDTVNVACKAIDSIVGLANIDMVSTGSGLVTFGGNMVKFAKKVKEFVEHLGEVGADSITSAIAKTQELIEMAKSIAEINVESIKTFGESLKKVAKDGVGGFVKEFSGEDPKSKAKKAVESMIDAALKGADEKKEKTEDKFTKIAEVAIKALCTRALVRQAESAGKDLVKGFANGIKNNKSLASNAGTEIGKAALKAAKESIDAHSPSREAEKLGNFFGQGLVIGIDDYKTKTYNAGYAVAEYAKNGLSRAIAKVSDLVSNGMNSNPTIRPILDLSDVESGVGYLSSMFNNGPSLAVATNLGAISYGMNGRNQNGTNDDVVSAINKLGKSLGNVGGDTYNINGVSYDDESSLADAVKTIIRAAKVERRS